MINAEPITITEYRGFQQAYDFFNAELFDDSLPHLLVTLQHSARYHGYFSPERFTFRDGKGEAVHEISMNPDSMCGRSDEEVMSTFVHEMVHLWQTCFGKPSRGKYHNKEWGDKMESIGLMPSNTGAPGGKRTGQQMTHYVIDGGSYARAFAKLQAGGFKLGLQSGPTAKNAKKTASKTKFTCDVCGQNAWAKADAMITCGACEMPMEAADLPGAAH